MRQYKTLFIFVIALLVINQVGSAQDKISGGSGSFYLGSKLYNPQSYDFFLEDGVDRLENNLTTVGGGGYHVFNNFMLGGKGFYLGGESKDVSLGSPQEDSMNYTYSLNGGGGYLTLGYVVYSKNRTLVFPQIGFGYEAMVLEKNLNENITLDRQENLSAEYRWASPMLDFSAGVDWFPFDGNGVKLGLRFGYNLSLKRDDNWTHSNGEFLGNDLPENNLDAFYINIVIGGGWIGYSD